MSVQRIWAVVLRYLYVFRRSLDRLTDSIYWPIMDIIVWGLTSRWQAETSSIPNIILMVMTGLVFWQIVWRANYEISINILEELWNQNLVNLFTTPLRLGEWMIALMVVSILKMAMTVVVGVGVVWVLYALNIFSVGWMFIPFLVSLTISGWFIGFTASSIVIYFGKKIQTVAWTAGFLLAPFSAVYYPLNSLPEGVRQISVWLPTTYVFEGMRSILSTGSMPMDMLVKSFALNALYLTLSMMLFRFMFEKSRAKGLSRLE